MKRGVLLVVTAALAVAAPASGAGVSWAAKADAVCRTYTAKARAALGSTAPKTPAEAYRYVAKGIPIEAAEVNALARIPAPTAAAKHAIAVARHDVVEGQAVIAAWKTSRARFATLFNAYMNDRRPKRAFAAAGANACG